MLHTFSSLIVSAFFLVFVAGAVASMWRVATDQNTGKTYYYHTVTRAVQWHPPAEWAQMGYKVRDAEAVYLTRHLR